MEVYLWMLEEELGSLVLLQRKGRHPVSIVPAVMATREVSINLSLAVVLIRFGWSC